MREYRMTHFVSLLTTTYDESGIPDLGASVQQWVNLDQVETARSIVTDTFFHSTRYAPFLYPHFLLVMGNGRELIVPLGECATEEEAQDLLRAAEMRLLGNIRRKR
jgi:hypothetical protein